jgi:pantoate--beta-alanine ligase
MKIVNNIREMQKIALESKIKGKKIALVPTMGFLHEGHLSLIRKGKSMADIVITTLFVNPTQFAPNEDFNQYPRDFERDCKLCMENGSDFLFSPETIEMYPDGYSTSIEMKGITDKFEGEYRPGHFSGVATVVAKLFNATLPDFAIFGQKDYQQTLVIKKLNKDLNFNIDIIIAETIREKDGLAMSSRNKYLNTDDRNKAPIIFFAISEATKMILNGEKSRKNIDKILSDTLNTIPEIQIDYASSALANTLEMPDNFSPNDEIVILVAAKLGKTRLIDNSIIKIPN